MESKLIKTYVIPADVSKQFAKYRYNTRCTNIQRSICFLIILAVLCISVCACSAEHTDDEATKTEITAEYAWVLFRAEVVSQVENFWGSDRYFTVSKFKYELVSWKDNGVEYEFYGNYTTHYCGEYDKSWGFWGTVDKTTGFVWVDSIHRSPY